MEVFWGVLFGVIAAIVLVWMVGKVIEQERIGQGHEFQSSEPPETEAELEEHRVRWDRSKEEGD